METYLQYLEQVLGLKNVILPSPSQDTDSQIIEDAEPADITLEAEEPIWVLFVAEKTWSQDAQSLFQKMREAMKVPAEKSSVLFADVATVPQLQIAALSAHRVVCFSEKLFELIQADAGMKFLTHDPQELLKRPQLKKSAWEDLKKVMKSLDLL